ncbi:MAG TPA: NYN domain-containing protein [Variovorax sp.]|nr:NYN domain-containing protein [Variovorax sp.]
MSTAAAVGNDPLNNDRVMLLIDADNVSGDIIEQAVHQVLAEHGALHVRRAYCTAEAALKHQMLFKRLGVRPMVNLAAGKNSTDIALAVDAMDLVVAERPRVVYLVSSDSDFAPLVIRLREKGCRVCGIGQQGKTGEETVAAYDAFTDLRHRGDGTSATRAATARHAGPAPASRTSRAAPAAAAASKRAPASATSKPASAGSRAPADTAADLVSSPSPAPALAPAPGTAMPSPSPATSPMRKTAARKTRGVKASTPPVDPAAAAAAEAAGFILEAAPSLRGGAEVALNDIAQALRTAGLLGRNASSVKLFEKLPSEFIVFHHPDRIRWIGAAKAR